MNKIYKERMILELSKSLLNKLYGKFEVIEEQIDSPDAAIVLDKGNDKIGIEITSVDNQKAQQYFNDEKISKDVVEKQLVNLDLGNEYDKQAIKKMTIPIESKEIVKQIFKKANKYDSYNANDDYKELIILAFSEYIEVDKDYFDFDIKPKVCNLLIKNLFQFDKVVFVSLRDRKAKLLFDKNKSVSNLSFDNINQNLSVTKSQSSILPFGKKVIVEGLFNESEPIVKPNFSKKKTK